jgi:putative SOS response-associated peptidase YedK
MTESKAQEANGLNRIEETDALAIKDDFRFPLIGLDRSLQHYLIFRTIELHVSEVLMPIAEHRVAVVEHTLHLTAIRTDRKVPSTEIAMNQNRIGNGQSHFLPVFQRTADSRQQARVFDDSRQVRNGHRLWPRRDARQPPKFRRRNTRVLFGEKSAQGRTSARCASRIRPNLRQKVDCGNARNHRSNVPALRVLVENTGRAEAAVLLDKPQYEPLVHYGDATSRVLGKPGNPIGVEMHQNATFAALHLQARPIDRNASEAKAMQDLFMVQSHVLRSIIPSMCYSAQVVQMARKLHRQLGIRLDYEEVEKLFFRRLDDSSINISRGFEANFNEVATDQEMRIRGAIDEHRSRVASKMEKDLFTQKTRLVNAERSLKTKETKKAREDIRIATAKIETLSTKLTRLRSAEPNEEDDRIFPFVYAGVIVKKDGHKLLTPMRYHCRPAGKRSFIDRQFPGLYNARRDNLEKFWDEQFGSHHAILVVESFYENVKRHTTEHRELLAGESEENVVLQFKPEPAQTMYIACLWSHWTDPKEPDLRGFAAITDVPPKDVADAGHDRCIINLKPEHIEAWLAPAGRSREELQSILSDRAVPAFAHEIQKAA